MFGRRINPFVLFAVVTLATFGVVFWATWSALQHPGAAPSVGTATKVLPLEVVGVLSWAITGAYGVWLVATGRKFGDLPRRVTGRALRLMGVGEVVLSLLAIWGIVSQPANTIFYSFVWGGIICLGIAFPLGLRGKERT
jgi:hypothetical protein